jgi:hypothetical protein
MTEAEWQACSNPWVLLQHVRTADTDRKLRLFVCACCERSLLYSLLPDVRAGVAVAKQLADGGVNEADLIGARQTIVDLAEEGDPNWTFGLEAVAGALAPHPLQSGNAAIIADQIIQSLGEEGNEFAQNLERVAQCRLVREIFGYPGRALTMQQRWQSANVVALAQAIYDEDDFGRLPILADALEDAGCTDVDMLNHCRQPGEHVRGCWVVDWVLGKQ